MPVVGYKFYGRNIRPYLFAPEKKHYTILGLTLFSLIVFGAFAIRPSLFTISKLNREVKKAQEAKTLLDVKINNLSQAQINYQLVAKSLELVDKALPKEPAVPAILENLALLAGRNNVVLSKTEFGPAPFCDGKRCGVPFTLTVTGDFASIEKFIAELESRVRQMDVERVKMSRGGEKLEYLVAEIELVTHFFEE